MQREQIIADLARVVHEVATHIAANQRQRTIHIARLLEGDGSVQLLELLLGRIHQLLHQCRLRGVARSGPLERCHLAVDGRDRLLVRLQVGSIAREQITTLPGFGIFERCIE